MFYSASKKGFFSTDVHGENIPADAVSVSETEHKALMEGQRAGKQIVPDENGRPVLQDRAEPTDQDWENAVRTERDNRLQQSVDRISPLRWEVMTEGEKDAWRKYRQDLLDIPAQAGFPRNVVWPTQP